MDVIVSAGAQVLTGALSHSPGRVRTSVLQDVSAWGTYLNGVAVERFVDGEAAAHEHELSHGASIRLADAVTLELLLR